VDIGRRGPDQDRQRSSVKISIPVTVVGAPRRSNGYTLQEKTATFGGKGAPPELPAPERISSICLLRHPKGKRKAGGRKDNLPAWRLSQYNTFLPVFGSIPFVRHSEGGLREGL